LSVYCFISSINNVINNDSGLLFERENTSDIAREIEFFYENESLRKLCSENLYQRVVKKYTSTTIVPLYEELYNDVFESSFD